MRLTAENLRYVVMRPICVFDDIGTQATRLSSSHCTVKDMRIAEHLLTQHKFADGEWQTVAVRDLRQ